jgi:hypothetical protein
MLPSPPEIALISVWQGCQDVIGELKFMRERWECFCAGPNEPIFDMR